MTAPSSDGVFSKFLLESRNITLNELSRRTGLKLQLIYDINRRRCGTTTENYEKLCRALMVTALPIPHVDVKDDEGVRRSSRKPWKLSKIHFPYIRQMADHRDVDEKWLRTEVEKGGMGWGSTAKFEELVS